MSDEIAGRRNHERSSCCCLTTLLVGDAGRCEFREAIDALRADSVLVRAASLAQAERLLAGAAESCGRQFVPDVVILAQSWPGQYAESGLDRLKRLLPVARFFALVGSWCEGEPRTGTPWPGAVRVYWYDWVSRWQLEKARLLAGACPVWGLPETATADERLLWSMAVPAAAGAGLILIHTRSQATATALEAACRDQGYEAERFAAGPSGAAWAGPSRLPRPVAAIWDGSQCQPSEAAELACFRTAVPRVPIVALLDFPRQEGRARALQAGAAQVVSKPYLLHDLFWALAQATASSRPRLVDRQPAAQGHAA